MAEALSDLVDYGRAEGLEWWTSEQIYQWEILRRGATAKFHSNSRFTLHLKNPLSEATLLFLKPQQKSRSIRINDQPASSKEWMIYGFEFDAVNMDLADKVRLQIE